MVGVDEGIGSLFRASSVVGIRAISSVAICVTTATHQARNIPPTQNWLLLLLIRIECDV